MKRICLFAGNGIYRGLITMNKSSLSDILFTILAILIIISWGILIDIINYEKEYKQEIQQKFNRDFSRALTEKQANISGEYIHDTENIILYTKKHQVSIIRRTAEHEIGHYIYYSVFNESQRNEWKNIYDNSVSDKYLSDEEKIELLSNGSSIFVSRYAETEPDEDFAESFSAFVLGWNKLDKEREAFMRRYVEKLI